MADKPEIVRYWHPTKGGWHYGLLVKRGRKLSRVLPIGPAARALRLPNDEVLSVPGEGQ